jgi:hypothetical protein
VGYVVVNEFLVVNKKLIVPTPLTTVIVKSMFSDFVYEITHQDPRSTKIPQPPVTPCHVARASPNCRKTGRPPARRRPGRRSESPPFWCHGHRKYGADGFSEGVPIEIELKNIG